MKILLDRLYGLPLLSSIQVNNSKDIKISIKKNPNYSDLISAVNISALLYDKILIEDTLGSSMSFLSMNSNLHPFWEVFEIVSFDQEIHNNDDELLYAESIKEDLNDKKLLKLIRRYYRDKGQSIKPEPLIYYLNKLILFAKSQNCHILPFPERFPILQYKFNSSSEEIRQFPQAETILSTLFEIKLPDFDFLDLEMILKIRADKRVRKLRELLFSIAEKVSFDQDVKQQVYKKILQLQEEIIEKFKPDKTQIISGQMSSLLPFPIGNIAQAKFDLEELSQLKKYSWYFLLKDIKQ